MVLNMVRHDNGTSIFAQLYIELSLSVSIVFLLSFHWNSDPTSVLVDPQCAGVPRAHYRVALEHRCSRATGQYVLAG